MQRKGYLLLAILCGLIAAGSVYLFLGNTQRNPQIAMKPLVIAKSDIPARSVIKADQLLLKDVPAQGYPQGGASSLQSVVGSVALVNLKSGDTVMASVIEPPAKNASSPSSGTTALTIPEGKRAVALPIGLVSGVGYSVKPGDHVDILVTMDIKDASGNVQTLTSLAAQDILVLSVGGSTVDDKNKSEAKSFTVALTVPQAMAVTLGSEKGSLRLLLRNPANTEQVKETPFSAQQFLDPNYQNHYQ